MPKPRLFNINQMEWVESAQFPGVQIKTLETRATHPAASVILVRVAVGGVIHRHVHAQETETAYVLAGRGTITLGDEETFLETGAGVTIPPGLPHSLRNSGDAPIELIAMHIPPTR